MEIVEIQDHEIQYAVALVQRVFNQFVAEEETEEGIASFSLINNADFYRQENIKVFVAKVDDSIAGVIAVGDDTHIHLLFVDENYHMQGIGRSCVEKICSLVDKDIYVNSSLFAYAFYRALGFVSTNLIQKEDGITYIPMVKRQHV